MGKRFDVDLSRRERQILDILYQRGSATAAEVLEAIPDPPSYSAVRAMLRVLEEKGHVRHEQDGPRYLYAPTVPRERARRSALRHLMQTFFEDSAEQAVATLLDMSRSDLEPEAIERLSQLIEKSKEEGR